MSDFNLIKVDDQHKTINAVKKAAPKTIEAIDSIVSSTINILGYIPNTINEYVQYSLDKTREKLHQFFFCFRIDYDFHGGPPIPPTVMLGYLLL